jgi:hypothetical protein
MSESTRSRGDWIDGFRVQIVYTEPEFRLRNPHAPEEFRFSIRYGDASTPQEAVARAMDEYQSCYENSWVAWRRVLKSVLVTPCERAR